MYGDRDKWRVEDVYIANVNGGSLTQYLGQISVSGLCLNAAVCSFFYNWVMLDRGRGWLSGSNTRKYYQRSKGQWTLINVPLKMVFQIGNENEDTM